MAIMLRRPGLEMTSRIPRRFSEMMDDFINESLNVRTPQERGFAPAADILEDDKYFYLNIYLPGLTKDDIHLNIDDNLLTVSGERKWNTENDEERKWNYHLMEGGYGYFERSFTVPTGVDLENIEAHFENGILQVQLQKAEERAGKQIEVK